MTYNEFKTAVAAEAAKAGLSEYDLYYSQRASTTVRAYEGEIDDFSDKTEIGACLRCIKDGKMGYSHTQYLSADEATRLVHDAAECADVLEVAEFAEIFGKKEQYAVIEQFESTGCNVAQLKKMAIEIEALAKAQDARITAVPYAYASYSRSEICLANSHGLDLANVRGGYTVVCEAVAEHEGKRYSGDCAQETLQTEDIDLKKIVGEAVELALGAIGGKTVKSGQYPIVFSGRVMREMLDCFAGVFSGDAAQKGLSLLAGREGEQIAADIVTIVDDPHRADSLHKSAFDDEGVPTNVKTLVENGVLKTLMYDMNSAAKAGLKSTGNGRKGSYAGDINTAPFNFILMPGQKTPQDLLCGIEQGLYITELKGMHASANAATGDFSLEAKGWLIGNEQRTRPAEQFTIAGNFYQLIKDIDAIANDFLLEGGVGSASVRVAELAVSGEDA